MTRVGASRGLGALLAAGALLASCTGRSAAPSTDERSGRRADAAPAAAMDESVDAPVDAPPATEPVVLAALADAIARDDGRALAAVIDPDYGVTVYATQGVGTGHQVLDAIAPGEATAPSRRPHRMPRGAPARWARAGWAGIAAAITVGLRDLQLDPVDPTSPTFGFCPGAHGLPGDGAPRGAYLLHDRDDRDLHMLDPTGARPRVPPLAGLTVFGNARLRISLRSTAAGWRVVHVVIDDRCRASPEP